MIVTTWLEMLLQGKVVNLRVQAEFEPDMPEELTGAWLMNGYQEDILDILDSDQLQTLGNAAIREIEVQVQNHQDLLDEAAAARYEQMMEDKL